MIAIMQPYFLPFIGYFQLINAVDTFVVYDDAQFTKKGFMTTNRVCLDGQEQPVSLNVRDKKKIDIIRNKQISVDEFQKSCRRLKVRLQKLPCFDEEIFNRLMMPESDNLFDYLFGQISQACDIMGINTKLVRSSSLADTKDLVGKDKIIALCQAAGDTCYVNTSGGKSLYDREDMAKDGIDLRWLTYQPTVGDLSAPYAIIQTLSELPIEDVRALAQAGTLD